MFFGTKAKKFQADYEMAQTAFLQGKDVEAEQLMNKWSKKGFADASDLLRKIWWKRMKYTTDKATKQQDFHKTIHYMKLGAEQGSAESQFQCGMALEFPDVYGLPSDYVKAFHYYSLAAEQGHNRALNNLGCLYQFGKGVERDMGKARELYESAAKAGNPRGYLSLGYMYQWGKGVQIDMYAARDYYYQAKNMVEEKLYLAKQGGDGYLIPQHMDTLRDIAQALEKWEIEFACLESRSVSDVEKEKSEQQILERALAGHGRAQFEMGVLCEEKKQYKEAFEWYKKAGENGLAGGVTNMGIHYLYGKGREKNYELAFMYLTKAEQMTGNKAAMYQLGRMYYKGYYVEQDFHKAFEWFTKAAAQGQVDAIANIGYMYEHGEGVRRDYRKAAEYYLQAEDAGILYVESHLADMYANGQGVPKDLNRAIDLMGRAAAKGNAYSKKRLEELYRERNQD